MNKIIYQNDCITKFLIQSSTYGNKEIIINTNKWDIIKHKTWRLLLSHTPNKFYVITNIYKNKRRTTISLHRFILNLKNNNIIGDHINNNTLDYTDKNLRICNYKNNAFNRIKYKCNSSGFKGVFCKRNKWIAQIRYRYKSIHLGSFIDIKDAALAYNIASLKYHKEFANLNYF